MIDFNKWEINTFRDYGGANGNKICMMNDKIPYMVKFINPKVDNLSVNTCISEYIGCHIFQLIGIKAQETLLGKYKIYGKDSLAVACKDFNVNGYQLREFLSVKNTCIDSSENGKGTSLLGILSAIEEQRKIDPYKLKDFFWNMFIIDAFIGNFDRHNGNWGILSNEERRVHEIAPIYDCGSCLYSRATEHDMEEILSNKALQEQRIFEFPTSALKDSFDKKINYFDYISSGINKDCTAALCKITPKIDMDKIFQFINNIDAISKLQKKFYCTMLGLRKERILDFSLSKLKNNIEEDDIVKQNLDEFNKRENNILYQKLPTDGIIGQYQALYHNLVASEKNKLNRKIINTEMDTKIVAKMLAEKKYSKSEIRQLLISYSPKAAINLQYVDKVLTRAQNLKYKKEVSKNSSSYR